MAAMPASADALYSKIKTSIQTNAGDVDALVRRLVHSKPNEGEVGSGAAAGAVAANSSPRRDFDMAAELLDRAGQAFDFLISRCQALEHEISELSDRTEAHAAEQNVTIEQWKQAAAKLQAQLETTEQVMVSLRTRCTNVENRAIRAEEKNKLLEAASFQAAEHAALAENLSTKLHDKVVSAFGIGSRAHPVLEAVATREAAE